MKGARAGREWLARTFYDVAQLLESADNPDQRVQRVLQLLRGLVPYDQAALLEARLGHDPHVVVVPETPPEERPLLMETLVNVFGRLADPNPYPRASVAPLKGVHLAVPLVGLDEVIGLLYVRSSVGEYTEEDLRALSVIGAQLAAYLTTLRARAEVADAARERDEARRASDAANRAKDDLVALVSCDPDRIGRVVSILVANTINLTPEGGHVEIRLERAAGHTRIQVSGDGDGDGGHAVFGAEVGFGLALVKDLVERCGARMRAESADPEGNRTFTVDVPRAPEGGAAPDLAPAGQGADDRRLTGIRVLFVDHDPSLRDSVQSVLDHYGAEVTTVATAPEALAALAHSRPDVLLFGDLAIRGEGAYDLMRQVTAHVGPLPGASISAWRLEDRQRELATGFQLHFAKPLEIRALVDAVAQLARPTEVRESLLFALPGKHRR